MYDEHRKSHGPGSNERVRDELAAAFESQRPRLLRIAYAIIGSIVDAEDSVQEAWLRLQCLDEPHSIHNLPAWLATTVSRLALDTLNRARVRREQYVGTWLPEPIVEDLDDADPAERVALYESVNMALMVVLESLTPAERTAFLLHDVFNLTFQEIAAVVGRTPDAVRKLASRARQHIERGRPRFAPALEEQQKLVAAFATACQEGDLDRLLTVLDPDVVWRSDGGGKVISFLEVRRGAATVASGLIAFGRQALDGVRIALVNGAPGLVMRDGIGILTVAAITIEGDRITAIDVVRNPEKLTAVHVSGV